MGKGPFAYFCPHCGAKTRTSADLRICPECGRRIIPTPKELRQINKPPPPRKPGKPNVSHNPGLAVLMSHIGPYLRDWIDEHNKVHGVELNKNGNPSGGHTTGMMTGIQAMAFELGITERNVSRYFRDNTFVSFWKADEILTKLNLGHLIPEGTIKPIPYAEAKLMAIGAKVKLNRAQVVGIYAIAMESGVGVTMEIVNRGVAKGSFESPVEVLASTEEGEIRYQITPDGARAVLGSKSDS